MVLVFFLILEIFDDQKDRAEHHRQNNKELEQIFRAALGVINRQRHCHAADDEDDGIDGPHLNIQVVAARRKSLRIIQAVKNIRHEQPAEEHDFLHQKDPHADTAGFFLLLHVLELVR